MNRRFWGGYFLGVRGFVCLDCAIGDAEGGVDSVYGVPARAFRPSRSGRFVLRTSLGPSAERCAAFAAWLERAKPEGLAYLEALSRPPSRILAGGLCANAPRIP